MVTNIGIARHDAGQLPADRERPVVKQLDPCGFAKGHGEIGVESLANIYQSVVDSVALAIGIAEKVHERAIHTGGCFAVPKDAQAYVTVERVSNGIAVFGIGEMNHRNLCGSFKISYDDVGGGPELHGQWVFAPKRVDSFGAAGSHAGNI